MKTALLYRRQESKDMIVQIDDSLNPIMLTMIPTLLVEPTATYNDAIRSDIIKLMSCDELHLLPGWQLDKASTIIRDIALRLETIEIVYH